MLLLIKKPSENKAGKGSFVLAGDIGATKINLALYKAEKDVLIPLQEGNYKSGNYNNITEIADSFIKRLPFPDVVCFGAAGPVLNGRVTLSNINWTIDSTELSQHFKKDVHVINDLKATAYGLAVLTEKDTALIHNPSDSIAGNAALIAPGTGLGEAGLYWDGEHYHPFAAEGGHCDFAPRDYFDFELYTFLQKKFGHVSWERLVSGRGIVNIYEFLRDEKKREEENWLKEKFVKDIEPAVISQSCEKSRICNETMHLFIRFLAHESANLVLKNNAVGGLFIGGGIAPQIVHLFEKYDFFKLYCQSGRLNNLLEKVPISIILEPKAALLGAAWYGSNLL